MTKSQIYFSDDFYVGDPPTKPAGVSFKPKNQNADEFERPHLINFEKIVRCAQNCLPSFFGWLKHASKTKP